MCNDWGGEVNSEGLVLVVGNKQRDALARVWPGVPWTGRRALHLGIVWEYRPQ